MKEEFYFDSVSVGKMRACCWLPKTQPVAVVQIIHGIAEHIDRYSDFADCLNQLGIAVVAEDHMGHGKSMETGTQGYFDGGWFSAVDNCYRLMTMTKERFEGLPYFLFGHSMGSFLTRSILIRYPACGIQGAVICGTGWQPRAVLKGGIGLCKVVCRLKGERNPSPELEKLVFGGYNERVEHPRTAFDWLSRNEKSVDAYIEDSKCGFTASAGLLRDMLTGMEYNETPSNMRKMNPNLPVLFIAGGDDPVGSYGEGVKKTAKEFVNAGVKNVTTRIFPLCRHEILNEINRDEIYGFVIGWLGKIPQML